MDPVRATAAAPDERALARAPELATPAQAARQFEALLISELLKRSQQPLLGESLLGGGSAGATYRELFSDELAQRMAAAGGLGLARTLASQGQEELP